MFGSQILEVAIGLILVYLVLSLLCSAIREMFEGYMKTRAAFLERGIRELLHDLEGTALVSALYNHPQIHGLFKGGYDPAKIRNNGLMPPKSKLPSYIPSKNFALALLDIVARGSDVDEAESAHASAPVISIATLRARITDLANPPVQRALLSAIDTAVNDLDKARMNVEAWYDSTMDRVAGWYKRRTQVILLGLGIGLAVAVNANTITIAQRLYEDQTLREALVAQAEARTDSISPNQNPREQLAALAQLNLPLGWTATTFGFPGQVRTVREGEDGRTRQVTLRWWDHLLSPLLGWILTGLAITLGAPFWFDLLNKFMVIRATVKPHEKSPEEGSEDRPAESKDRKSTPPERPEPPSGTATSVLPQKPPEQPEVPSIPVATAPPGFTPQKWVSGDPEEGDL